MCSAVICDSVSPVAPVCHSVGVISLVWAIPAHYYGVGVMDVCQVYFLYR